jgi:hypothetical protein
MAPFYIILIGYGGRKLLLVNELFFLEKWVCGGMVLMVVKVDLSPLENLTSD